jgi:hypothetical protein
VTLSNNVQFDAKSHEYRVGGEKLPSVTGLLKKAGLIDTEWMDEAAMTRGTYVHEACQYDDEGGVDEASLDPVILPYVLGWRKAKRELGLKVLEVEQRVCHEAMRYCGTLDRVVGLRGRRVLVDLKTGSPSHWHRIQTAAYAQAKRWMEPAVVLDRAALYLTAEGRYRWEAHQDRTDFEVWKAVVTLTAWMERNGV